MHTAKLGKLRRQHPASALGEKRLAAAAAPPGVSNDFVQHVRTVYLALLVLAGGLIAAASSDDRQPARAALPIVQEIKRISEEWDRKWVDKYKLRDATTPTVLRGHFFLYIEPAPYFDRAAGPQGYRGVWHLKWRNVPGRGPVPSEGATATGWRSLQGLTRVEIDLIAPRHAWNGFLSIKRDTYPATPFSIYVERPPSTLAEFQDWWDKALVLSLDLFEFHDDGEQDGYLTRGGFSTTVAVLMSADPTERRRGNVQRVEAKLGRDPMFRFSDAETFLAGEVRLPDGETQVLSVGNVGWKTIKPDPRDMSEAWKGRPRAAFYAAFPELHDLQSLAALPLASLNQSLESQAAEVQTMELGGLRFRVAQWGILLILVLQIYMWLLVREMHSRMLAEGASGLDSPWIGAFGSILPKIAYVGSLLVAPIAVWLLAPQLFAGRYTAALAIASSLLSFLAAWNMSGRRALGKLSFLRRRSALPYKRSH